jgi:hypothetical protein
MVRKAYFMFNLKPGKSPAAYERWSKERNHPVARSLGPIVQFHDARVVGTLAGGQPTYQFLEEIEVTDFGDYEAALAAPEMRAFAEEWSEWVADWICLFTERIA